MAIGHPYVRAATISSTTTYLTPSLTLGAISMNSITSSSLTLLSKTNVVYNFTIENTQNINGFILTYEPYFYYIDTSIACKIDGSQANCSSLTTNSIFVSSPTSFANNNLIL